MELLTIVVALGVGVLIGYLIGEAKYTLEAKKMQATLNLGLEIQKKVETEIQNLQNNNQKGGKDGSTESKSVN